MSISPFACHFGITYKCNLLCDHCYADKYKNTADFTYEELCNIVDQLYDIGIIQIIYSHGENIMHKDFWRITKYMRDRGFYVTLMTNGTFIRNLDISQKLYNTGVRQVFVSFDSMDPEKHDQRRRVPGSFRRAENALKYFSQVEGIRYGMAVSIDCFNWREIDKFIDFGLNNGVNDISFLTIRPNNRPDPKFNIEEYKLLAQKIINYKFELKGKINIITHDPLIPILIDSSAFDEKQREEIILSNTCEAGRSFFSIAPNGAVRSCNMVELVVGNVKNEPLIDIINRFRPEIYDDGHPTRCSGCKFAGWCRGGCKAFSILEEIHLQNNFFDADQRCLQNDLKLMKGD